MIDCFLCFGCNCVFIYFGQLCLSDFLSRWSDSFLTWESSRSSERIQSLASWLCRHCKTCRIDLYLMKNYGVKMFVGCLRTRRGKPIDWSVVRIQMRRRYWSCLWKLCCQHALTIGHVELLQRISISVFVIKTSLLLTCVCIAQHILLYWNLERVK